MLFKLEKNENVLDVNPQYKVFDEFASCTDRELRYLALCYDYDSPFRRLPYSVRHQEAADKSGYKREKDGRLDKNARTAFASGNEKLAKAKTLYMKLQYDQEKDLLEALATQISQIIELMKKQDKKDAEWDLVKKLTPELPKMISQKKELEIVIGYREKDAADDMEEVQLSAIELFHEDRL